MRNSIWTLILIGFFPALVFADLRENFASGRLDQAQRAAVQGKRVVFISGNGHEDPSGKLQERYFQVARKSLENVGAKPLDSIFPPSGQTVTQGSEYVYEELQERRQKSLLVIAHSKGGPEAVLALLRHPELIEQGTVDKMIVVQGSMKWAVDALQPGAGNQSLGTVPLRRAFQKAIDHLITSQGVTQSRVFFRLLKKKIFFVRAKRDTREIDSRVPARYKGHYNDGILFTEDESLDPFDTRIGRISLGTDLTPSGRELYPLGHCDLFCGAPEAPNDPKLVSRFFRAVIQEVY